MSIVEEPVAIEVLQGESRTIRIGPVIDEDTGQPLDLSAPELVEWQVKDRKGQEDGAAGVNIRIGKALADATLSLESEAGSPTRWFIVIPLLPGDTGGLCGAFFDDCVVVVGGQRRFARPPQPFRVHPVVNQP